MLIRMARVEERAMLEQLQRSASLANPGDRDALLAHPEAIELPEEQLERGQVLLAEIDGVVRGFGAIVPRGDGGVELDALFVDPAHWRQGIGLALLERLMAHARASGVGSMHVVGNPHALRFYLAAGFVVVGEEQTRFGPAPRLQRSL